MRDQQYLKQLQDSITQLERRNKELTNLKAQLSTGISAAAELDICIPKDIETAHDYEVAQMQDHRCMVNV